MPRLVLLMLSARLAGIGDCVGLGKLVDGWDQRDMRGTEASRARPNGQFGAYHGGEVAIEAYGP